MMAPTVVLRDGEIELGLGSAGSNRIRSAILQTIVRAVEQGMGAGEAVRAPRLHFEQGVVQAEPGIDEAALARLEARGMPVARRPAINLFFGGVQAVARDPRDRRAQRRRRPAPRRRRRHAVSGRCAWRSAMIDFEAEGLLDGLEGEAREARLELLERLAAEGVPLRGAARGGRRRRASPCCRSSGRWPATAPATRRARSPSSPASTSTSCSGPRAALGIPYPDPDERSADRGRPRGGASG